MKKAITISAMLIVLLVALGLSGFAYAQTQTPPDVDCPFGCTNPGQPAGAWNGAQRGPGMMGSRLNGRFQGMMGAWQGQGFRGQAGSAENGPLHEYMLSSLAQAFNLSPEALEERHDNGESMWDIAQDQGLTNEQFQEAMLAARTTALNQAVSDGSLTQEQADWMLSRMSQMQAFGARPGTGACHGTASGGRWNSQPANP